MTADATPGLVHQAAWYRDPAELTDVLAPRVEAAVSAGDPVVLILPAAAWEELTERLPGTDGVQVLDPDVVLAAPAQTVLARLAHQMHRLVADGGHPHLMGTHHAARARGFRGQLEAGLNLALADLPVRVLCCYRVEPAGDDLWRGVRAAHPELLVGGAPVPNADYRDPQDLLAEHPAPPPLPLGAPARSVEFDVGELQAVRALVAAHARAAGLSEAAAQNLVLAVNEVVTNSVEHGAGCGTLRLWSDREGLTCEVRDGGLLREALPGVLPPPPQDPRGRGVWLARELCAVVHVWSDRVGTGVRLRAVSD